MKLATNEQMAHIDSVTQEQYRIPDIVLMENAGQNAYRALRDRFGSDSGSRPSVVFVAGSGNNGGDALVMARAALLDGHYDTRVVAAKSELKGLAGTHLESCEALGIPVARFDRETTHAQSFISEADVIVDGMAGTGIRGELRGGLAELVEHINGSAAATVSVDVPSGVGDQFQPGYTSVQAELTLTMGLPKRCLYYPAARRRCGEIVLVPVGFPPALTADSSIEGNLLGTGDVAWLLPALPKTAYKTKRGVLGVFAGSRGTTGAAVLAATAAARSSAGMVRIHADESCYEVIAGMCRSVMVAEWSSSELPGLDPYAALLVGPGWGREPGRQAALAGLAASGLPGVVDADGLNVLADMGGTLPGRQTFGGNWVLTPHPGELARLVDMAVADLLADPLTHLKRLGERLEAVIVLKSHVTYVVSPGRDFWVLDGMNPAMATGGSGDVLAGIIGGLLTRGLGPEDAAKAGVVMHDLAGREAYRENGWFLAEDLLPRVSELMSRYQRIV